MLRRTCLTLPAAAGVAAVAASPADPYLSAIEASRRIRRKELSARELLEMQLKQIERVNPKVNAIVTLVADAARRTAARLDEEAAHGRFAGPLHGLPMAHKDLQDTAGIRTTYGSPLYRDHVPERSTLMIERLQQAGAVTIGKTNTPEFGAGSQTFNPVFGPTRNPYDLGRTCGGSSGGAAVALACGMIPLADGSDTGGSLRNPASFCSVVGFRSSPGRIPRVPSGAGWNTISVNGPMARSVEDVALLFSAMAGPDPRFPIALDEPGEGFRRPLGRDFKGVRIAWMPRFAGLPFDRRIAAEFAARRREFESLGCIVEEVTGPDFSEADEVFKVLRALSFYSQHAAKVAAHRGQIKATVLEEVDRGAKLTGPQIAAAETKRSALFARMGEFLRNYEYMVLPTTQVPPFPVETEYITEIDGVKMGNYIDWMRSCWYITILGNPAISVPGGYTPEGLPVGVQIVGRHHADFAVLQLAHAYEQASRKLWRRPAVS